MNEMTKKIDLTALYSNKKNVETLKCPLCGEGKYRKHYNNKKKNFKVVQCLNCGLVYNNPRILESIMMQHYDVNYGSFVSDENAEIDYKKKGKYFRKCLKLYAKKYFPQKGKFLDVGCGYGTISTLAKEEGWESYGVDICCKHIQHGISIGKNNLIHGSIDSLLQNYNEYFDLITSVWVFEHLYHPVQELKNIFKLLKKGGGLSIFVPNNNSIIKYLKLKDWYSHDHVTYWTPDTIKKLLLTCGFSNIECDFTKRTYHPIDIKHQVKNIAIQIIPDFIYPVISPSLTAIGFKQ